jgi:eukaryotic-like serine/threonine-protein kinase
MLVPPQKDFVRFSFPRRHAGPLYPRPTPPTTVRRREKTRCQARVPAFTMTGITLLPSGARAMQEGQTFGPFVIEKPLGSGAMGAVYRARYKDGRRMALKIIGLGLVGNETSRARFDREASILKQLNHPNIVRFYGAGRSQGTPYYAMEYIEGESLDHVMNRRGRLTWEEVIQLGGQLCDALQHAHEKGIIHRDLKPSNLMVLADGTIKLTDFGIAKDTDVTALTAANCTVGTAAYMSPEQCRGDRDLTFRSDLYSLGVLFYELLTGRKPFIAETPMNMFLLHLQAQCERPSRLVLDTPVWLDNLICQLLEKKPEQRPRDAAMVKRALDDVLEKVEALQSAGVDAVRGRRADQPRRDGKPAEEDRAAARTLKQAVTKKKAKKKVKPFYEKAWFRGVGIVLLLVVVGGVLYWVFQPPSADSLHHQAEKLMKSENPDDHQEANATNGPLAQYLKYYGKRDDDQTKQVRGWVAQAGREYSEKILDLLVRSHTGKKTFMKRNPETEAEKLALSGALAEEEGDHETAREAWQGVKQQATKEPAWGLLADEKLNDLVRVDRYIQDLAGRIETAQRTKEEFKATKDFEKALLSDAIQAEIADDPVKAREAWGAVKKKLPVSLEQDPDEHRLFLLAARRVHDLTRADNPPPK